MIQIFYDCGKLNFPGRWTEASSREENLVYNDIIPGLRDNIYGDLIDLRFDAGE